MSHDRLDVQRLRFAVETTFGTDLTSDVATNFKSLRAKPTQIMRTTMTAPDETVKQRFRQQHNDVIGPRRGECAIESYWTGTNETLNAAASPTKTSQSMFLEHVFGGYTAAAGSASASGEATTGCVVTGGQGSRFSENTMIGATVAGVVYPRLLATRSTDTLVWWPALPSALANASAVLNSQTIYYDDTTSKWLQLLAEARLDRGDIWLLRGAAAHDFKMSLSRGGLVSWSCSVKGAIFSHDDEITTPQGGSALTAASFTDTGPKWGQAGGCHLGPSSSSVLNLVECVEFSVTFGTGWIETPNHAGVAGIGGYDRDSGRIEVTLTILIDASAGAYETLEDAFEAETNYGFLFWLGATGGNIISIGGRTCQIAKPPEATAWNGLKAKKITLLVKENASSTGGATPTTALAASPLVISGV